ncbi:MAG: hypothetical protein V8R52_02645 [Coprobacter fastidiosus]
MNTNGIVGKLILNDTEYTEGTFDANSHSEFFEGNGTLTGKGNTSGIKEETVQLESGQLSDRHIYHCSILVKIYVFQICREEFFLIKSMDSNFR